VANSNGTENLRVQYALHSAGAAEDSATLRFNATEKSKPNPNPDYYITPTLSKTVTIIVTLTF